MKTATMARRPASARGKLRLAHGTGTPLLPIPLPALSDWNERIRRWAAA